MSNSYGNMLVVYKIVGGMGIPEATIEGPWPEGTEDLYTSLERPFVIMARAGVKDIWVDLSGPVPLGKLRQDGPWTISGSVYATNEDPAFQITNLPVGSIVSIGQEEYQVDDGVFEFISPTAGTFTYRVSHWPYYDFNGQVTFQ